MGGGFCTFVLQLASQPVLPACEAGGATICTETRKSRSWWTRPPILHRLLIDIRPSINVNSSLLLGFVVLPFFVAFFLSSSNAMFPPRRLHLALRTLGYWQGHPGNVMSRGIPVLASVIPSGISVLCYHQFIIHRGSYIW